MASKLSLIAVGLLLLNVSVNAQQSGRRSQDRQNQLRSYDDSTWASRNYNVQYNEQQQQQQQQQQQRYAGRNQDQDLQDRRNSDYDTDDYSYGYAVRDELSGDVKSQQEVRHGDRVRGQYRTLESDGTERIVDYTADDFRGFNAVVRHQPSVGSRAQLVHTIQPAVLLRQPSVGQLVSGGHRTATLLTSSQQPTTVLLRN
ncbi:cuticle protein-like [Anopheles nili]|uniref:cuticle protein-like n=1 Tax=Anopheles nili TaxID=185578 RepID=UPI00237AF0DE|nr:cuticle protein-like [Anopheles nili]